MQVKGVQGKNHRGQLNLPSLNQLDMPCELSLRQRLTRIGFGE